jgi:hypothetical protein
MRWASATTMGELEAVVRHSVGSSDLMEFVRFDSGDVLRKEHGGQGPRMLRMVVGNPLIMKWQRRFPTPPGVAHCSRHQQRFEATSWPKPTLRR